MALDSVIKRDGKVVDFDISKIEEAVYKAAAAVAKREGKKPNRLTAAKVAKKVYTLLQKEFKQGPNSPSIEDIQDKVEKALMLMGHAKTARAYVIYREERARARSMKRKGDKGLKHTLDEAKKADTTDMGLFVRVSADDIITWDRNRIVKSLVKETEIDEDRAFVIAYEVEKDVKKAKIAASLTAPLIRELVNAKLTLYGLVEERARYTRLGVPAADARQIIMSANKENANIPHNPEATNLHLAETIKKEFALLHVFSRDVADAHMRGDIHLHDLGFIDRPYCSGQSLEYVKKFGLDLPRSLSIAKPAKHPETLLAHMVKFSAALQGHFAGAIGWDAVNLFFAPFTEGMSDKDLKQLTQMLIYEYSQQAVARGGQAIFSDVNIYWEVPDHFADVEAIGPGGKLTGRKYKEYEKEAQRFAWKMFEVYAEGDGCGRPFFFPKPLVHITRAFRATEGSDRFMQHICEVAAKMGNTYFVFDRGSTAKISECCRLSFELEESDLEDAKQPWRMRYSAIQNATLNLPRAAYRARGNKEKLFANVDAMFDLTVKAHLQKRKYIEELLAMGDGGPLAMLAMKRDGEPYLRMHRATHLVGILGLNEMVQAQSGAQMHETQDAYQLGVEMVKHLGGKAIEHTKRHGIRFVLEQTPAESTAYRFARLDMEHHRQQAQAVIKGDVGSNEIYYTNSTQMNIGSELTPFQRIMLEGRMHPYISAGALSHIWLADSQPDAKAMAALIGRIYRSTQNAQVAFSPEFTACNKCNKVTRGLGDKCGACGTEDVDHITRVTGYFSRTSGWNKGKTAELRDRFRSNEAKVFNSEKSATLQPFFGDGEDGKVLVLGKPNCQRCAEAKRVLKEDFKKPMAYRDVSTKAGKAFLADIGLIEHAVDTLPLLIYEGQLYTEIGRLKRVLKAEAADVTTNA